MAEATILLVDNEPDFLNTWAEYLEQEGYHVVKATGPTQGRRVLEHGGIDLAILDIRLQDDDDEKDTSGLTLAKEVARSVPKIMLTDYPSVGAVRVALKPQLDGLPVAVEFMAKEEGPEALIRAVRRALGPVAEWLQRVKEALDGTDKELKQDYDNAQRQSISNYWASLGAAMVGILIIFFGIALVFLKQLEIGLASAVGGVLTEAISYLFFRRVDVANRRMDRYHKDRIEGQWFNTLLQACDGLESEQARECRRERVIAAATERWLGIADSDKDSLVAKREGE